MINSYCNDYFYDVLRTIYKINNSIVIYKVCIYFISIFLIQFKILHTLLNKIKRNTKNDNVLITA